MNNTSNDNVSIVNLNISYSDTNYVVLATHNTSDGSISTYKALSAGAYTKNQFNLGSPSQKIAPKTNWISFGW